MSNPALLRHEAETLAAPLPPLLVAAKRLAATVELGVHGRRRSGMGEAFWQYRQALPGDPMQAIDWRRSARSDHLYLRETEWEAAETVALWCDTSAGMGYASRTRLPTKLKRAGLIALSLSVLLDKAGERIGLMSNPPVSGGGELALQRIADAIIHSTLEENQLPYGLPHAHAHSFIGISDFLGPEDVLMAELAAIAQRCHQGALIQVLDPQEVAFPFRGRVIFESMAKSLEYESHKAQGLNEAYQARLRDRQEALARFCRRVGWQFTTHVTDHAPAPVLLWAMNAIGDRTR